MLLTFNAASAGVYATDETYASSSISYRNQWLGFEGAPTTISALLDYRLKEKKIGLGLTLFNDRIGTESKFEIGGNYAYRIQLKDGFINAGIRTGVSLFRNDFSKINNSELGDIYSEENDQYTVFSLGLGFVYKNENITIGFAIPSLFSLAENDVEKYKSQHFYFTGEFKLGDYTQDVRFEPNVSFKYHSSLPAQIKIGVNIWVFKKIIPSIHFRMDDAIILGCIYDINSNFTVGLGYEITVSELRKASDNSIEIFFRHRWNGSY